MYLQTSGFSVLDDVLQNIHVLTSTAEKSVTEVGGKE